jgi:energy-converting hydrogenase Eha subunit C
MCVPFVLLVCAVAFEDPEFGGALLVGISTILFLVGLINILWEL